MVTVPPFFPYPFLAYSPLTPVSSGLVSPPFPSLSLSLGIVYPTPEPAQTPLGKVAGSRCTSLPSSLSLPPAAPLKNRLLIPKENGQSPISFKFFDSTRRKNRREEEKKPVNI